MIKNASKNIYVLPTLNLHQYMFKHTHTQLEMWTKLLCQINEEPTVSRNKPMSVYFPVKLAALKH